MDCQLAAANWFELCLKLQKQTHLTLLSTTVFCFELQCYLNDGLSRDLVINMDETPVKICTPPRTSIGKKGTGALKTTSNRNHMQQLTCMLAVTMSGRKLKPAFVCNSNQLQGHFATHASQIC